MGNEAGPTGRRSQTEYVCPVCGQPVGTVIKRRKTLGVFAPIWGPGPCRNPECSAYVADAESTATPAPVREHQPEDRAEPESGHEPEPERRPEAGTPDAPES